MPSGRNVSSAHFVFSPVRTATPVALAAAIGAYSLLAPAAPAQGADPVAAKKPVAAAPAGKAKLRGSSEEDFVALFLQNGEVPGMKIRGDFRNLPAETDEAKAEVAAGKRYGRANWVTQDPDTAYAERMEDYRWSFPTVDEAKAFFKESGASLAGPDKPLKNPPKLGDESLATGGEAGAGDFLFKQYAFVFRVDNVVCKLFAVQSGPGKLSPLTAAPIAQKMVAKIRPASK